MYNLVTCLTRLHIYSPTTLSCKRYLYYNISSDAPTPRSPAQRSCFSSLSIYSVFNSILWLRFLHRTWQPQESFPDTHPNCPENSDGSGKEASCKSHSQLQNFLCNSGVDKHLLNYVDAPSHSIPELMVLYLSVHRSPGKLEGLEYVSEFLGIIRCADFDFRLPVTLVTDFSRCRDILDRIVERTITPGIYRF